MFQLYTLTNPSRNFFHVNSYQKLAKFSANIKILHAAFLICLLGFASSIHSQTHKSPIDDAIVVQNHFESTFFAFRYEFPAEWHTLTDITRIADNKERYDKQLQQALAKNGPNTPNNKTEVFPNYNLLIAGPSPVGMERHSANSSHCHMGSQAFRYAGQTC